MSETKKKVLIKTYGCQMNVYDSERMGDVLAREGYDVTEDNGEADLVILNTCHIREKAAEKVYSELGRVRQAKERRAKSGKETIVAVAGCVAQAEGAEMAARAPVVDFVVGPQSYHHLPELLQRVRSGERSIVETEFPDEDKFDALPHQVRRRAPTAFLTVQEGCDKFCTFCVVPYTRGAEFSRPVEQIMAEARKLVSEGVCEITLLGQNVNAYHGVSENGQEWTLAQLLHHLAELDGLERIRYTTSHPVDMTDDLIAAHASCDKIMPYLHLPFQAGSDRILKAMNRKHTMSEYFDIIAKFRDARPDIALSTDIIVGFPGETEEDFLETLNVVETVNFAQAFSFKYSGRPGTPAATMEQVEETVKSERLQRLQALLNAQQLAFNESCLGRTLPVLIERKGRVEGTVDGRSPYLQPVHISDQNLQIGDIVPVEITSAGPNSLKGVINQTVNSSMTTDEKSVYA